MMSKAFWVQTCSHTAQGDSLSGASTPRPHLDLFVQLPTSVIPLSEAQCSASPFNFSSDTTAGDEEIPLRSPFERQRHFEGVSSHHVGRIILGDLETRIRGTHDRHQPCTGSFSWRGSLSPS
jgi:hypothetical protein